MFKSIKRLLNRKPKLDGYPDITPRGYRTTYQGVQMTIEEKNENFIRMFNLLKS